MIRMKNKRNTAIFLGTILLLLLAISCNLDNFSPAGTLNPSLVLSLSNAGGYIAVTFTAQNSQDYCYGYNIYLGNSETEVTNKIYPLSNINDAIPTITKDSDYTTSYTYIISNNNSGLNGGGALPSPVYIGVAAWGYDNDDIITSPILIVSNYP